MAIAFFMGETRQSTFFPFLSPSHSVALSTDSTNPIELFTLYSLYRGNYSHIKMSKSLFFRLFAISYQTNVTHQLYYINVRKTHLRSFFGVRLFKFRTRAEQKDIYIYIYMNIQLIHISHHHHQHDG